MLRAVRGAVGVRRNSEEAIHSGAKRLLQAVLTQNRITEVQIVSVLFSLTKDLTKGNPATGVRSLGFTETPLFCLQEADIEGSLPGIIRVLVTYSSDDDRPPKPVYLGCARNLRPDLTDI